MTRNAGDSEMIGQIFITYVAVPEQPFASVALMIRETPDPLEMLGVPEIVPETLLSESPTGRLALWTVHVYGAVPPETARACE